MFFWKVTSLSSTLLHLASYVKFAKGLNKTLGLNDRVS